MSRRFNFWFWSASILQLLTGSIHGVGLFIGPTSDNPTEQQLLDLMNSYHMEMGAGFHPTMMSLFLALSSCYTMLCFLAAWLNIYLKKKNVSIYVMKGVMGINAIIFGICFFVMLFLTFLPPIVLTGMIFVCALLAYLLADKGKEIM